MNFFVKTYWKISLGPYNFGKVWKKGFVLNQMLTYEPTKKPSLGSGLQMQFGMSKLFLIY